MLWFRAIIIYGVVILLFRVMGRGLQFQSRPYDQAVQILIGSAAANMIVSPELPLARSILPLAVLTAMHILIAFASLWNPVKTYLVGRPTVVIENGLILRANLIKHQITVDELLGTLREKGYRDVSEVEFALLEPSGKLSVVPRSQNRPLTPKDLGVRTPYEGMSIHLITDGQVNRQSLQKAGLSEDWLLDRIHEKGANSPAEVLFASLDTSGQIFMVRNQDVPFLKAVFQGVQSQTTPGNPPLIANSPPPPPQPH